MKNIMSALKHWWLMRSYDYREGIIFWTGLLLIITSMCGLGYLACQDREQAAAAFSSYSPANSLHAISDERECWGKGRIYNPFPDNPFLPICMSLDEIDFIAQHRAGRDNVRTAMWQQAPRSSVGG